MRAIDSSSTVYGATSIVGPPAGIAEQVLGHMYLGLLVVDSDLRIVVWNRFLELHSGRAAADLIGRPLLECFPELPQTWLERRLRTVFRVRHAAFTSWRERAFLFRFPSKTALAVSEGPMRQDCGFFPLVDDEGQVTHVAITVSDATDSQLAQRRLNDVLAQVKSAHARLAAEIARRDLAEAEMRRAQRLEAVGQLAGGVAHEINTPLQFMLDNASFLQGAVDDLLATIDTLEGLALAPASGGRAATESDVAAAEGARDLPYLREKVPQACATVVDGAVRVGRIVAALKDFARADAHGMGSLDVNATLQNAVMLAQARIAPVADVETQLGSVPPVECAVGSMSQVFLELLVNAAEAIGRREPPARGKIKIETEERPDAVVVSIADDGCGIAPALQARIFDPFFTTKPVGEGTGHGLAMVQAIVSQHGGKLTFTSEVGRGTTFRVELPIVSRPL